MMTGSSQSLLVAGVGASAGGLEAMLSMFSQMHPCGRISFVVAQHMAKDGHDELVTLLLGRESLLPVVLAEHGARLMPDRIYVIPSGKDGRVEGDTIRLSPPAIEHVSTPSVNALFSSIAESQGNRAIGIILSGTGSDGLNGCRSIRSNGGLTLAQDPDEAKFNGMPQAAIEGKVIDRVLPMMRMGTVLAALFPGSTSVPLLDTIPADALAELDSLLKQVRKATGMDFSSYKEDTLLRRLEKRKAVCGTESPEAYQALIRRDPEELKILQHLFLVSVSSFFRDRLSFDVLKQSLPGLVAGKKANEPVRIWVPGCATGEEPFTLAIMLRELIGTHPIEIIASDLNPEALAACHEGSYRPAAFKEMDVNLRDRYFVPEGQDFRTKQEIRACVRFEQRDVLNGTPPDGLDMVSCRNLLIYLKSHLQDQLIKIFHQALRPQGLLFIGQAESLSFVGNSLFVPIDHYHRLFRRRY
jgi:chemotaxis protein methyltransferase CheR/two-component system CheB/CheR fusion protein